MAAYGLLTTDDQNDPRLDVFESLVGPKPIARFGWSYWDELDLRKLATAKANGRWSKSRRKHWDRAWPGHAFHDKVSINDLLFYRNLPAKGRFTLVQVTGEYDYLPSSKARTDFRSYRPCKLIAEDVLLSDSRVGPTLRTYLKLQGRIYEIPDALALAFVQRWRRKKVKNTEPSANSVKKGAELEKYKKRFSYAIGAHEVTVNKEHQAYQLRLKAFLRKHGLAPDLELDRVDVSFETAGERFIGEVKVTNWLSIEEAFRIAVGQVLDYGRAHSEDKPNLLMFFDSQIDSRHVELATDLRIGVVVEISEGDFKLLNPAVHPTLKPYFLKGAT